MIKIVNSNLTKRQLNFLHSELNVTLNHAGRCDVSVPQLDITLVSRNFSFTDAEIYKDYTEQQRKMQSFEIKKNDAEVLITGGAYPGILNGLYSLLKNQLGIRWYGMTEEDVYWLENPILLPEKGCPDVPLRGIEGRLRHWSFDFIKQFMLWMTRNSWNQLLVNASDWRENQDREQIAQVADLCGINLVIGGHSFKLFLPDETFTARPDFFGMRNGVRCIKGDTRIAEQPDHSFTSRIQPCLSNPECTAFITQNVVNYLNCFKDIKVFSLWPHDGVNNWCQCPRCLKYNPYKLMHQLARQILAACERKIFIELLAYSNLLKPPGDLPFEPSIYTLFCPYLRNYRQRLFDPGFADSKVQLGALYPEVEPIYPADDREYGQLFKKWLPQIANSGGTLGVFAYYQLVFHDIRGKCDRSRYLRHPDPNLVQDELHYFIRHGMQVYYDCSWPYPGFWPDGRLYSFYSRLLWNCNSKITPLIEEYNSVKSNVAQLLDKICALLDSGNRNVADLETLVCTQSNTTTKQSERLNIWLEYVKLAMISSTAATENAASGLICAEEQIIKLLEDKRAVLEKHVSVDWMINYSKSVVRQYSNSKDKQQNKECRMLSKRK
jgi:Domain of unknown function (DUF4838)